MTAITIEGQSDDHIVSGGDFKEQWDGGEMYLLIPGGTRLHAEHAPEDEPEHPGWRIKVEEIGTNTVGRTRATEDTRSDYVTIKGDFDPQDIIVGETPEGLSHDELCGKLEDFESWHLFSVEGLRQIHGLIREEAKKAYKGHGAYIQI